MSYKQKKEYRYVGAVETRAGNGTWRYNGEITDCDSIGTTFATSCYKASRNILYKYITQKLGLSPNNIWRFRLAANPRKVKPVKEQADTVNSNITVVNDKKFVQMSIFDVM